MVARKCRLALKSSALPSLGIALATSLVALIAATAGAQPNRPNVVVILSDDAGYNEFGFSSALTGVPTQYETPNLDALALQSKVARNGYASPLCTPSRVGLLTGLYQHRFGIEQVLGNSLSITTGLPGAATTIGDRMKALGYSTGMVGKWHVGYQQGVNRPNDMGFDEFFGFLSGGRSYYAEGAPSNFLLRNSTNVENEWRTQGNPGLYDPVRGRYLADAIGEEAANFINNHANDEEPFFLYMAPVSPHDPYITKQQDYDHFAHIADPVRRTHAAMQFALDRSVGMVTAALAANGVDDETIVIFANDNGGPGPKDNAPFNQFKNTLFEGGVRVPYLIKAPGLASGVYDAPISILDVAPTIVAAAGGAIPADQTDGVDLLPHLSGADATDPHEALFFRQNAAWGMRKGNWKFGKLGQVFPLALYNVVADRGETINLVNSQPAVVQELSREFTRWEAQMDKPRFSAFGVADRNDFDHFVFRVDQASATNWNAASIWHEGGAPPHVVTMIVDDAYASAILEFPVKQGGDFTAANNMTRQSGMTFMANELRFTGIFSGAASRTGTINGAPVLLVTNLAGQAPRLLFSATSSNANGFAFAISNELQLLNDLEIAGNGTQAFTINGAIKDYDEPRSVVKTGTSVVTLGGANTFGGSLMVTAGRIRLNGPTAAIDGAASISIGNGGTFELNDGRVDAASINVSAGGSLVVNPSLVAAGDFQANIINQGSVALGGATPGTLIQTGAFQQTTGALRIRIGKESAINVTDKLQITGTAQLGGLLDLEIVSLGSGNLLPMPGDTFQILSAIGGLSGTFATTDLPLTSNGLGWQVLYTATTVSLKTLLAADFDANGVVDGLDLVKWKAGFGITSGATFMQGDADRDGDVDSSDFFAWQRSLGLSAASFPAVAGVPEPATASLLLCAAVGVLRRRRRV
jgi:autotransporter-associated beta strand protein